MVTTHNRHLHDGESLRFVHSLILPGRVLDVGCGHRHHTHTRADTIWLDVDITRHATDPRVIAMDAREVPVYLRRMHFTTILLLDVIEHLEKDEGGTLLNQLARMTARIVLCTPVGPLWIGGEQGGPQEDYLSSPHTHKCGWHPEELERLGYQCEVWTKMHGENAGGFFAWKDTGTSLA